MDGLREGMGERGSEKDRHGREGDIGGERERERGGRKRDGWSGVRDRKRERRESESSG